MAYNFQTGKNKIKLLTKYESVTQEVLVPVESLLQNPKELQTCMPFMTRKMSERYAILFRVFSSICSVTVLTAASSGLQLI
jgi:hypothetical protein